MLLKLKRVWKSLITSIGTLHVYNDGDLENSILRVFTLEDVEREDGIKVFGKTAIPKGRYEIVWTYSQGFKRNVLMLLNVENFDRIYIHAGNKAEDTLGCIICGLIRGVDRLTMSTQAVDAVYLLVGQALERKEMVFIEIS
jgi:hypothetical protein